MTNTAPRLKAPFPAFGGKSAVAPLVWERLGDCRNVIEPFCFSLAFLLNRPHAPQIETVNDLNAYVANFWRAVQRDPEAVAAWADGPVNEADLHARHRWLVHSRKARASLARVKADPDYFDAKIAGWWCWGACCWIGSGWCDEGRTASTQIVQLTGHTGTDGVDVHDSRKFKAFEEATAIQRPILGRPGERAFFGNNRPQLADAYSLGRGVNAGPVNGITAQHRRPQLTDFGRGRGSNSGGSETWTDCQRRRAWLVDWFVRLSDRLRPVRVCCGHWARVCDSDSTLTRLGTTGVFLDPPYRKRLADGTENRAAHLYANDKAQDVDALCDEVQAWCLKWGGDPEIRIALCGLEGEYPALDAAGWDKVPWKSRGGYGNRTDRGKENAARERIWYSRACLKPGPDAQFALFGNGGAE